MYMIPVFIENLQTLALQSIFGATDNMLFHPFILLMLVEVSVVTLEKDFKPSKLCSSKVSPTSGLFNLRGHIAPFCKLVISFIVIISIIHVLGWR